ncbi:hypothetical protein GCM10011317_43450 [Niveispirillum cyanobacteriorum]|nr:hypothetical protein GCM10011317_43450 [Niveispirillum cyanobacteriorum]
MECVYASGASRGTPESFQKVLNRRVVCPITDENQLESLQQLPHEVCGPAFRKIGVAEIGGGYNELLSMSACVVLVHHPVQMYNTVKCMVVPQVRQIGWRL